MIHASRCKNARLGRLLAVLTLLTPFAAAAADSSPAPTPSDDPALVEARKLIKVKDFKVAVPVLKAFVSRDDKSADGWNLLGFSTRKSGDPATAETYYKKALALDDSHRGALEYLGMMYVEAGRMEDAKAVLKRLDKACFFGCEEYDDLKKAVETGKAN